MLRGSMPNNNERALTSHRSMASGLESALSTVLTTMIPTLSQNLYGEHHPLMGSSIPVNRVTIPICLVRETTPVLTGVQRRVSSIPSPIGPWAPRLGYVRHV